MASGKGQGLKVLITGSLLQLSLGILYVWSVFVGPVSQVYSIDVESVKLTSSFMLCFFVVGILVGGKLTMKIGAHKVVLVGGMMLAMGMLLTAFLPTEIPFLIYLTYGIVGGFGVGAAYNAILTSAQKWFPEKRGLATGVSVCAFGFATVLFAPLVEMLIRNFELRNTFMILAAGFFVIVLSLFHFIRLPEDAPKGQAAAAKTGAAQATMGEALRSKEFYLITISMMLATATFFILNPSFKTLSVERGLGESFGTVLVMMTGVANALGRLCMPVLSDKMGREKAALSIILLTAASALILCFASGFPFVAAIAVAAFCYGGFSGTYPVLTSDYFGVQNIGAIYGGVMVGFAVSALAFPPLVGLIGSETAKFIALAALELVGAGLVVMLMISKKRKAL